MGRRSKQKTGWDYRREESDRREILQAVADADGCYNYDTLYVRFDLLRTGNIGPLLHELISYGLLTHEGGSVKITAAGRARLKEPLPGD